MGAEQLSEAGFRSFGFLSALLPALFIALLIFFLGKNQLRNPWLGLVVTFILVWLVGAWINQSEYKMSGGQITKRALLGSSEIPLSSIAKIGVQKGSGAFLPLPEPRLVVVMKPDGKIQGYVYKIDYFSLGSARRWTDAVSQILRK